MSNSATNLDLISVNQAQKEVSVNALLDAASPAMLYGRRAQTSGGLVWGYYGGTALLAGVPTQIANGTIALTASATNYLEADPTTGAVSKSASGFSAGAIPLYQIVAGASTVSSYTDLRAGVLAAADPAIAAAAAVAAHAAASDPHSQYLTQAEADALYGGNDGSAAVAAHVAASDPHTQYQRESEKGAANGYASLGADGKVPAAQLPAASSSGTVTSVALTTPGVLFDVTGSPVTTSGTLAMSLKTQTANKVLAGPVSGADAAPTMRALVDADIPALPASRISDFSEAVDDRVGALLVAGTGVTLTYNDAGNALTVAATASGGTTDAQTFTASGTWTKPSGVTVVEVICIGGGGGGGGGNGGAAGTARCGGTAGGGGAYHKMTFSAADLPATVAVTVGAGGTAGSGGASASGTDGTAGGNSSFGSYLTGYGGGAGAGGAAATAKSGGSGGGTAGAGESGNTLAHPGGLPAITSNADGLGGQGGGTTGGGSGKRAEYGGAGGAGVTAGASAQNGGNAIYGGAGGGAGGGVSTSNLGSNGGPAGEVKDFSTAAVANSGGLSPGGAGVAGAAGNSTKAGQGGGGGAGNTSGTGGAGGAGGSLGGGGGGGGGGTSTGGNGGAGGRGEVRIYSY